MSEDASDRIIARAAYGLALLCIMGTVWMMATSDNLWDWVPTDVHIVIVKD